MAAGLLSALAACTSTGSSADEPADAVAVKFRAYTDSRGASVADNNTIKNTPFAVYGDMVLTSAPASTAPTVIFNGTPVRYSTADNAWQYDDPQYWFPSHTHSFVAIHPNPTTVANLTDLQYQNNRLSFKYTIPDYTNATDLLSATHRRNYTGGSAQPVAFNFAHILSRLNFIADVYPAFGEGNTITIEKLSLHNVSNSATYAIAPAAILSGSLSTDDLDATSGWNNFETIPEDHPIFELNTPVAINGGKTHEFFPIDNPLFIIPQNVPENIEVRITYKEGNNAPKSMTAKIYTSTVTGHNGLWLAGKSYTYTFSLGVDDKIIFQVPRVDPWVNAEGGNYIISD